MKKYLVLTVVVSLFTFGCSTSNQTTENGTNPAATNRVSNAPAANTQTTGVPGNAGPTPGTIDQIPVVPMPEGANANTAKLNRDRKIVDTPGVAKEPTRVPAAENSEVSSTMDKEGNFVESRFFRGNPQLDKVERTYSSPSISTLKIFLKGGKVVTVPGDKVKDFVGSSSSVYLELAGIKAPGVSAPGTGARSKR